VDGFIDKFRLLLSTEPTIVATGGSAQLFLNGCDHTIHYDPDLTLKGLRVIYQLSRKKKNNG
jgi:pantothenate kinase type III